MSPERTRSVDPSYVTVVVRNSLPACAKECGRSSSRCQAFENVGAYSAGAVNLGTQEQPQRVNSAVITSELMPVLGVQPQLGRAWLEADEVAGRDRQAEEEGRGSGQAGLA